MTQTVGYGPRLVAHATGAIRAAVIVEANPAIENARALPGEPSAIATRAVAQQAILAKTLRYFGCEVTTLQTPSADPYASAVSDCAVVFENGAVMLRPSSLGRRPEATWLEEQFVKHDIPIAGHIAAPGLLDGSDVLMLAETAFVGASARSNAIGRAAFGEIARAHGFRVVEVRLSSGVPSLRSVAGVLAKDALVVAGSQSLDHAAFAGFSTFVAPRGEELGAGVLNLSEHHVLADVRYPRVNDMLRKGGITVDAIDLYDFGRVGITPSMLVLDTKRV